MSDESKFPEHDKLRAVSEDSQSIGEFLDIGLGEQDIVLCEADEYGRFYPTHKPIQKILATYFDIDLDKIEVEKRAMLAELREMNR